MRGGWNTGLLIEHETTARVIGNGTVIVVDGSAIEINHIGYADNGHPFAVTNVLYSVLTRGVVFDLQRRVVVDPGPIAPPKSPVPGRRSSARNRKGAGKAAKS